MAALKALELQQMIKTNNNEYADYLKDLNRWQVEVKKEDQNLQTEKRFEEKLPPIRKKVKTSVKSKTVESKSVDKKMSKEKRISSYDYDQWSKFDVESACDDIVSSGGSSDEDEGEEDEKEEEMLKIQEERKLQQAAMEKEKGNQLFKDGKYEAAINRYTNAITLHPNNPILYANRGMALLKTEKYGAAEQDCSVALQYDPNYTKALLRRATARKKLKKYDMALHDYQHVLKIESKNKQALQEVDEVQKLLVKSKASEKENKTTSEQINTIKEMKPMKKRRSNKPLKRIHIEEIGVDDVKKESFTKKTSNKVAPSDGQVPPNNERIAPLSNLSVPTVADVILTLPTSSFIFETEFRRLKNDEETLYRYLKMIPVDSYTKLFTCIDILLSPFLHLLHHCYIRDKANIFDELQSLASIKRFDMAAMFLSKSDKKVLQELFKYIQSDHHVTIDQRLLQNVASKYSVKL